MLVPDPPPAWNILWLVLTVILVLISYATLRLSWLRLRYTSQQCWPQGINYLAIICLPLSAALGYALSTMEATSSTDVEFLWDVVSSVGLLVVSLLLGCGGALYLARTTGARWARCWRLAVPMGLVMAVIISGSYFATTQWYRQVDAGYRLSRGLQAQQRKIELMQAELDLPLPTITQVLLFTQRYHVLVGPGRGSSGWRNLSNSMLVYQMGVTAPEAAECVLAGLAEAGYAVYTPAVVTAEQRVIFGKRPGICVFYRFQQDEAHMMVFRDYADHAFESATLEFGLVLAAEPGR